MKPIKKHTKKLVTRKPTAPKVKEAEEPSEDKSFDFGGLPQRDLKKNLGCG